MLFCDSGSGRAAKLAQELGGTAVDSLAELALQSDAVVLAMKPGGLGRGGEQLGGAGDAIASVLAATRSPGCASCFPRRRSSGRCRRSHRGPARRHLHAPLEPEIDGETGARLLNMFGELSHLVEVPDALMDEATAVMGCTPAYLAVIIQNIAEAGAAEGLDAELAYELVLESFAGTIELLRRYDPIEVRASVASRAAPPRPGSRRSPTRGSATACRPRSGPRSSGCAPEVILVA